MLEVSEIGVAGTVEEVPRARVGHGRLDRVAERDRILIVVIAHRAGMREQHGERDRPAGEGRVPQRPAEILGSVDVEVELARLDQLHDADRRHQLADRCDADGIVDGDEATRLAVGETVGEARDLAGAVEGDADLGVRPGWGRLD